MKFKYPFLRFGKHLAEPLRSISENPYEFVVWWTAANVFGLAGFWLPILLLWVQGQNVLAGFHGLVNGGVLSSFSVVLLIEGLASIWVVKGTGTNFTAVGIRGFVSILALIVAVIQVSLLSSQGMIAAGAAHPSAELPKLFYGFQIVMTAISVLFASYLFCFRFGEWEKGVDAFRKEDDRAVSSLADAARLQTSDGRVKV